MSRVLIVGAGLTGSLCACLLRRELRSKVQVVVWDKARGAELLSAGLLRPLDCHIEGLQHKEGNKDYVTPLGTSSVVKHFLSESGADLYLEYHVTGLYYRGGSWEVERNGGSEKFDAVILTMPVPQILLLQGDLGNCKTLTNNQKQNQSEVWCHLISAQVM
ncbi:hypothetical protein XENOCAPTIV_025239 [Xenoophorus captivus]|uniref:Amine oxidase domain-containing protein n=1 Tax=Xenoophorus captivus TaxID=1517983 RepID=A0ABV0R4Y1_9TELE